MGLSSVGSLDIQSIVDIAVKKDIGRVQARHDKQLESANNEISALGQLKSALSNLDSSLSSLSNISQFYKMKHSLSETGYFSATVTDNASPGVYQILVQALAQSQTLVSSYFPNNTSAVGSGNITINFGTYSNDLSTFTPNTAATSLNVTITPGGDSLSAVCDAINGANSGVTACIVQDSLGSRLSLTSTETGINYSMQIISDIPGLTYDPTTSNTSLTQTLAAQNSIVQVNGIELNESSNQIENMLTGISLNLKQANPGQTISLTVENNQELLTNSVHDFVKKYNECISFLNNVTGFNRETKQAGFFQNDAQVKSIKHNLFQKVTNFMSSSGGSILTLADIGITTYRGSDSFQHGILKIDETAFSAAVSENFNAIGGLFATTVTATDPNIQINSTDTSAAPGTYDVFLDEYTPAVSITGTIGGLPATSSDGITLTGSGELSSLSIKVLSGTDGNRGQIVVNEGLASLLSGVLDGYLEKNSLLNERNNILNRELKHLAKDQERIDDRSKDLELKYTKKWNAVQNLITQMEDTSNMLTSMIDNLPKFKPKS